MRFVKLQRSAGLVLPVLLGLLALPLAAGELQLERGWQFSWPAEVGVSYQLQQAPAESGPWSDLGLPLVGDGSGSLRYHAAAGLEPHFRLTESVMVGPPAADLPVDGGFELGSGSGFQHWATAGSSPPLRWDGDARSGSHSLRSQLVNPGAEAREGLAWQFVAAEGGTIEAGERYDFSFFAKQVSSGVSYVQQHELQWLDGSGGVLGGTGLVGFGGGDGSWDEVVVDGLVAPAGAADARVFFRFVTGAVEGGHGEVLIDDVRLVPAGGGDRVMETSSSAIEPTAAVRVWWFGEDGVRYQPLVGDEPGDWLPHGPERVGDGAELELVLPVDRVRRFVAVSRDGPDGGGPLPDLTGDIVPLFTDATPLAPEIQFTTAEALVTRVGDRARDRHAREDMFMAYDHYLSWYWEERTLALEITDKVAMGGSEVVFDYVTQAPLGAAEFRAFFRGIGTVAEYHHNQIAPLVGPNHYRATLTTRMPENRPLAIGDRIEIEISQFLADPANGRSNYYGTAILYVVGEGIVPWRGEGERLDSFPLPESARLGGLTTLPYPYSDEPEHRFKQTAGNIAPESIQDFMLGRRLHHTDFGDGSHSEPGNPLFVEQAGKLGPQFIARSCVECHVNNGRALPPDPGAPMLRSVVKVGIDGEGRSHPQLGGVLQPQHTGGPAEAQAVIDSWKTIDGQYGDGTPYQLRKPVYAFSGANPGHHSTRLAPPLVGLGLLEAVDEVSIAARADPDDLDGDGISGRLRRVLDPETGEVRLGRFTAKAGQARLRDQIAAALNTDMGVTTRVHPVLDDGSTTLEPELSDPELERMTTYVATLGVAARRDLEDPIALAGEARFGTIGCADCHVPAMSTGAHHPLAELRNQAIQPFTDLLLHDMGPGLADNMGEGDASGAEWRTAPLWNIGLTAGVSGGEAYLHDGRARSLEEAILWHGGEGEAAKEAFRNLPAGDRAALIRYLRSL